MIETEHSGSEEAAAYEEKRDALAAVVPHQRQASDDEGEERRQGLDDRVSRRARVPNQVAPQEDGTPDEQGEDDEVECPPLPTPVGAGYFVGDHTCDPTVAWGSLPVVIGPQPRGLRQRSIASMRSASSTMGFVT